MSLSRRARDMILAAPRVLVLTGAGISTASGIADYRGPEGVWTKNPTAERASHIDAYVNDAAVRRASWQALLTKSRNPPVPNAAHDSLARFARTEKLELLVTQNIDGLHLDAGTGPRLLVEIHGHTRTVQCRACGDVRATEEILTRVAGGESDPHCEVVSENGAPCGGILATSIVRFGDSLNHSDVLRCEQAARSAGLLLCVGTTLSVYPVAGLVPLAMRHGAKVIIVNNAPTDWDDGATCVRGDITEVLPEILGT